MFLPYEVTVMVAAVLPAILVSFTHQVVTQWQKLSINTMADERRWLSGGNLGDIINIADTSNATWEITEICLCELREWL